MSNQIEIQDPDECVFCGWSPPQHQDPEGEKTPGPPPVEDCWLNIPMNGVVWLHVCPKCGAVMGSKNAVENVKKLQEIKKQKIVQPKGPLALPKGPLVFMN